MNMDPRSSLQRIAEKIRDGMPMTEQERIHAHVALMGVGHLLTERINHMFICGAGQYDDGDSLPRSVSVCPAYGSDYVAIF